MGAVFQRCLDILTGILGLALLAVTGPAWWFGYKLVKGVSPWKKVTCVGIDRRQKPCVMFPEPDKRRLLSPGRSFDVWQLRVPGTVSFADDFASGGETFVSNLPLAWNLLRGDISLFGPQLIPLTTFLYLKSQLPKESLAPPVKPGLLGLSQLDDDREACLGRYRRKIQLNEIYYERKSILLDLQILIFSVIDLIPRRLRI